MVSVPTRMARIVIWPSRITVAANAAPPLVRVTGRPSPVMVFWSIVASALDDLAVDRDHLAGIDDDEIADRELRPREST